MKSNLREAFKYDQIKSNTSLVNDYEVFEDKDLLDSLRMKIVENIIDNNVTDDSVEDFINFQIDKAIAEYNLSSLEKNHLFNLIDNEIKGYGPLTELLKDENITEIMVNSPHEIYIELEGNLIKDDSISFINDEHIIRTIQRLVEPMGRTIDSSSPMVDSRLKDGSRINAVIPPLSTKGPVMTIRKFKKSMNNIEELLRVGSLTTEMAVFLEAAVKSKLNIIVCGGTGSGKTTLLNVLSAFINEDERIITIEDAAEIRLTQPHVISLETRTTNYEKSGEITIRDLVRNSLRMRPDRIIVGEVRNKEAFDMLQAMNTGHEGSITTLHANGCKDALHRLETMVLMGAMELPVKAIREYINSAINIVINMNRYSDGKRKISAICEVDGFENEEIRLNDIFTFEQIGVTKSKEIDGVYKKHKIKPKCLEKMSSYGYDEIKNMFK
ncbi:MAG: CpaF family protein [Mollicutes bacterium]|nr:CpaF family protein [Mollicutes bacterium]